MRESAIEVVSMDGMVGLRAGDREVEASKGERVVLGVCKRSVGGWYYKDGKFCQAEDESRRSVQSTRGTDANVKARLLTKTGGGKSKAKGREGVYNSGEGGCCRCNAREGWW